MKEKIKLIFIPFLILALSIIIGYTFLNWLLVIKLHVFDVREDLVDFFIPFLLPWVPALLWLRPRINLLNLKRDNRNSGFGYLMVAVFTIAAPTIIAQFYKIANHYIGKENHLIKYTSDVSGRSNQYLNLHLYIVAPIYDIDKAPTKIGILPANDEQSANTSSRQFKTSTGAFNSTHAETTEVTKIGFNTGKFTELPKAWLCMKYDKQVSNRLSTEEKKELEHEFFYQSLTEYNEKNLDAFTYLQRTGNTTERDRYKAAINKVNIANAAQHAIILEPKFDPFENRNGNKLVWIFGSFGIGASIFLLLLSVVKFKVQQAEVSPMQEPRLAEEGKSFIAFFKPREGFYVTPILIMINLLVFIAMVVAGLGFLSFSASDLLHWGGNYKPYTNNGQWWRLITSMFMHGGLMHVLANMYGLLFVGIFLEPRLKKRKYLAVYLATGIIAGITSLWWHNATVSVGASGAIFGLYGAFLALLLMKVYPDNFNKALLTSTFIFIGYNLAMGFTGAIDNAAHIGGLVSGFIIGLALAPSLRRQAEE